MDMKLILWVSMMMKVGEPADDVDRRTLYTFKSASSRLRPLPLQVHDEPHSYIAWLDVWLAKIALYSRITFNRNLYDLTMVMHEVM
jgi:hypothetical protein